MIDYTSILYLLIIDL